jgi:hypothetical protein
MQNNGNLAMDISNKVDVALSFAGEDLKYVDEIAKELKLRSISLFYAPDADVEMWGKNLPDFLKDTYQYKAKYVLMFISSHYINKPYPNVERKAAIAQALRQQLEEYILLIRLDNSQIPGIPETTFYMDAQVKTPAYIVAQICKKLGKPHDLPKASHALPLSNQALQGEACFDYSDHDGRFSIGVGSYEFETKWSRCSTTSIYCYNDPANIHGISLIKNGIMIGDIKRENTSLNFTSRTRQLDLNHHIVLENKNGHFALIKALEIQYKNGEDEQDLFHFSYQIITNDSDPNQVLN